MSDIKEKLHKVVDELPDSISGQVLEYLNKIKAKSSEDLSLAKNLNKILKEDSNLLERLAK